MFFEFFERAKLRLRQLGLESRIVLGAPVSEEQLTSMDQDVDAPMPRVLRNFYLELGDGFEFIPDVSDDLNYTGWTPNYLADYRIHNKGFVLQVEEDATLRSEPVSDSEDERFQIILQERRKWIPFYDFSGDGSVLCLDDLGRVRCYEPIYWPNRPRTWDFVLAGSFLEFVQNWNRYCFICPSVSWTSFCLEQAGVFGWDAASFPEIVR